MPLEAGQKLILAFVTLILGVVLISTIASNSLDVTSKVVVTDESHNLVTSGCVVNTGAGAGQINESDADCNFTVTNYPTGWKIDECPLTSTVVGNATKDFTANTDYIFTASSGIVVMKNTTTTQAGRANTTLIDYTYCPDDYLNQSWGRSVLNMVAGFFAIALLMISIGLFFSVAKDYNII